MSLPFDARMRPSVTFEASVISRLEVTGWMASPFGQAQLPEVFRRQLWRFVDGALRPSLIRWMPDIIALRPHANGGLQLALIDAKTCTAQSANFSIESSALDAAETYVDRLYTPTFFVFDNWTVLTPRDVRHRGCLGPMPSSNQASGTAYVLVPKCYGRPFDSVFPPAVAIDTSAAG
jgi:hypothetical protein